MMYEPKYPFTVSIEDVGTVKGVYATDKYHAVDLVYYRYSDRQPDRSKFKAKKVTYRKTKKS